MTYDLKITGGTIVDGTGTPGYRGDVGIANGRIVALGQAEATARQTIDAAGRVVCPGFIDIHTHYDFQLFWDPMLSISSWHGVTTVVIGNCGFGIAPTRPEHRDLLMATMENVEGMDVRALREGMGEEWPFETFPELLEAIERRGVAVNVGALIGHSPVRLYVMGTDSVERAATADEVARMEGIVSEALDAGAIGFATSKTGMHVGFQGRPVPSRLAELDEIRALAGVLGRAGRGIMMAAIGRGLFFKEFAIIAEETGRPICWAALLAGMKGPGSHRSLLDRVNAQQAAGLEIYPQVMGRPIKFDMNMAEPFLMDSLESFKAVAAADREGKKRFYADPAFRAELNAEIGPHGMPPYGTPWQDSAISYCPSAAALEGRTLRDVAREQSRDPLDVMLDLSLESDLKARFRLPVVNTDENEVRELITDPATVLGLSDAGAHASQLCDACFATDMLGRWVREKRALALEDAVRIMTSRPADLYGLVDRGRLAEGACADVVVFDPATVACGEPRRVTDFPAGAERLVVDAYGIDTVICNGAIIRRDGEDALGNGDARPGQVLRSGRPNPPAPR